MKGVNRKACNGLLGVGPVGPASGHGWFCDPVGGSAFIDGVFLVTDSINRREADRVMPIVKEEQVALCRLLRDRVRAGDNVLDVGTGSGVFGIYTARTCRARVVCIDVEARSCEFAKRNARANGLAVAKSMASVGEGEIAVVHEELGRFCRRKPKADIFILNPPFTPTIRDEAVAVHARGGYDGQRSFEYQMRTIGRFVSPGNKIVGYQMLCGEPSDFGLHGMLSSNLPLPFVCEWTSAIAGGEWIEAGTFIPAIYGCGKQRGAPGTGQRFRESEVMDYFVRRGVADKKFAVIAYVVTIKKAGGSQLMPLKGGLGPVGTWANRVWLHARILDGAAEQMQPASNAFRASDGRM